MSAPAVDPVAAFLALVRLRSAATATSAHGYVPHGESLPRGAAGEWVLANLESAADIPPLLAMTEAVLALAAEFDTEDSSSPEDDAAFGAPMSRAGRIREAMESALRDAQGGQP